MLGHIKAHAGHAGQAQGFAGDVLHDQGHAGHAVFAGGMCHPGCWAIFRGVAKHAEHIQAHAGHAGAKAG